MQIQLDDGTFITVPEGTSPEKIEEIKNNLNISSNFNKSKVTENEAEDEAGLIGSWRPEGAKTSWLFDNAVVAPYEASRKFINSTQSLVEGLGDTLGEKTNIGGFVFGEDAENGIMGYENYETWKAKGREDLLFGKAGVKDAIELPDFEGDPQTIAGGLTKGVSQFLTGWFIPRCPNFILKVRAPRAMARI